MFDWRHQLSTTDPAYYKWTQWIFLQLLKAGKAYKKSAAVNWCPKDMTVLANEQVINGRCERCDTVVEQRTLEQWFFRITEYAPRLLADLDDKSKMDWSDTTTTAQRNWLGRSEGAELEFPLAGAAHRRRDDPRLHHPGRHHLRRHVHGARPRAPAGGPLASADQRREVDAYRKAAASQDLVSRKVGEREKTGVFTGGHAVNPATGKQIPVWIADYVLMEYGTGAIMAVPGHDDRDFEFAAKFGLPIVQVVAPSDPGDRCPSPRATATPASTPSSFLDNEGGALVNSASSTASRSPKPSAPSSSGSRGGGRQGGGQLPPARLVHLPPALLGPADPHHLLRRARRGPGPGAGPAGALPLIDDFRPDDTGVSPLARHESGTTCRARSAASRAAARPT